MAKNALDWGKFAHTSAHTLGAVADQIADAIAAAEQLAPARARNADLNEHRDAVSRLVDFVNRLTASLREQAADTRAFGQPWADGELVSQYERELAGWDHYATLHEQMFEITLAFDEFHEMATELPPDEAETEWRRRRGDVQARHPVASPRTQPHDDGDVAKLWKALAVLRASRAVKQAGGAERTGSYDAKAKTIREAARRLGHGEEIGPIPGWDAVDKAAGGLGINLGSDLTAEDLEGALAKLGAGQ